jgi:hypothetical protein
MPTVKASVRKPVTGKGQLSVKESIFRFIKLGIQYLRTKQSIGVPVHIFLTYKPFTT